VDIQVINGSDAENIMRTVHVTSCANFKFNFPKFESPKSLTDLAHLQGLFNLDEVLVITRFAKVRPWGSSHTCWEMARGKFTIEGWIEVAWIMGYIKHFEGELKNGNPYVG
jgi:fatty acid synthase subunit alpha, fungi type/fatty acid synthase subunit beta, fungi type